MSNQEIFDNIRNNFNSEDEDNDEDEQFLNNRIQSLYKRRKSLNSDNKIRENISNNEDENEEKQNIKKSNRDIFGYFINNDGNEESEKSEKSNSNNEEKEKNSISDSDQDNEYIGNNNSNQEEENSKEKNSKNNLSEENSENQNENLDKEENNKNDEEINNNKYNEDLNTNKENEDLKEQKFDEDNEDKNLIDELYTKKSENLEIVEREGLGKYSFRPNPQPISPKFNEKIPKNIPNKLTALDDIITGDDKINNNNFAETIETKIEGDNTSNEKSEINPINKDIKEVKAFEEMINNSDDKQVENKDKNNDEEENEEEAFLKREEIKRQKSKENKDKINNNEDINNKKENINDKLIENKENSINNIKNDNAPIKNDYKSEIIDNKIKNMSLQILEQNQKAGDNQSSKRQSNKYFNNNNSKKFISPTKNKNKNNYGYFTEERAKRKKNNNEFIEKYSFTPNIDKRSRNIWKKINKRPNTPIGILLYEEANNKKEKLNQKRKDKNNSIILNANSKKINNNSYLLATTRINKKINDIINKYSKNGKISVVGITQCLYDLNIITELIKIKDNIKDANDYLDSVELQAIIESINNRDIKKLREVEFIEQLWIIINPSQTQYINSEMFSQILKILFSSNNDIKDLEKKIENILEKYNTKNSENDSNKEQKKNKMEYFSPLRDKTYNENEKWPLSKLIKYFLKNKRNLKAYRDNNYKSNEIYNNILKDRDKDLTFKPNFISKDFFYKHSKYDYNKDINNIQSPKESSNTIQTKKKNKFDKIYDRFMAEKELHEKTLELMRKIKMEKELKKCTRVPKTNKYMPHTPQKLSVKDKFEDIEESSQKMKKNKSFINNGPRKYKKLYNLRKNKNNNKNDLGKNYTFKPELISNKENINKMKNIKKPKGYDDYIKRNRDAIEKKKLMKKIEEEKKSGKNYEKMKKSKLKPFNITDLNEKNKKTKKLPPENLSNKNEENNNEKNEAMIDDIYITIDIKIPNGLLKPLKIYNKNNNDTIDKVNEFCKIYSINDENKKMIIKKVIQCKNAFFARMDDKNQDDFIINEDLDTITNSGGNSNGYT